jgi:hypothetical protein
MGPRNVISQVLINGCKLLLDVGYRIRVKRQGGQYELENCNIKIWLAYLTLSESATRPK